ncbi:hypothetical protein SRB5_35660 [Streptomyces sp. RB5]|uniref:Aminodeoxyfutalosine deaminase/Imidazolonepropionase-like composite domain-containing protein n=1 Tax=Streptomyces smaragdinus TaxID=2585196 RepID=A0A7K0CIY1_9ACTN|nr:hypothetical protein [Streptomyces smaragdinus]MQY13418.1 hypothetical protein [Streptomyces smaragdinus]
MATLHVPDELVNGCFHFPGQAVLVEGRLIAALGPYEELAAAHPEARVRRWPGQLAPGICEHDVQELLEHSYFPDPREAGELGTEPLTGDALDALGMDEARWGASARRGLQRLMARGIVEVCGEFTRPAVRDAVQRSGMYSPPGHGRRYLEPGGEARFAVWDGDGCVVAVVGGTIVFRRR